MIDIFPEILKRIKEEFSKYIVEVRNNHKSMFLKSKD